MEAWSHRKKYRTLEREIVWIYEYWWEKNSTGYESMKTIKCSIIILYACSHNCVSYILWYVVNMWCTTYVLYTCICTTYLHTWYIHVYVCIHILYTVCVPKICSSYYAFKILWPNMIVAYILLTTGAGIGRGSFSSVQFSRSVVSNCLWPHASQHTRPPCPSLTPGVYSNSCPWVGDAIQQSHPLPSPSPPAPNLSQHHGLFQWVSSSHQVAKVWEFQLQYQSFQWTPRTDLR